MNKPKVSLLSLSLVLFLLPSALQAQDPQPVCCPRSPGVLSGGEKSPLDIQGQFFVSSEMLQSQGVTRRQFVDRLSSGLFPGKPVDVILSSKAFVTQPSMPASGARSSGGQNLEPGPQGLIAIQETLFYRIPLYFLTSEELERLDQFGLTDGEVHITVKFVKNTSLDSGSD